MQFCFHLLVSIPIDVSAKCLDLWFCSVANNISPNYTHSGISFGATKIRAPGLTFEVNTSFGGHYNTAITSQDSPKFFLKW